jgi:mRNA interferase HigB
MHVISRKKLKDFWEAGHAVAEERLKLWFKAAKKAEWTCFADMGATFGKLNVDRYGICYIFDVGGNDYRIIAEVSDDWLRLYIREVLTHSNYNKNKWRKRCEE